MSDHDKGKSPPSNSEGEVRKSQNPKPPTLPPKVPPPQPPPSPKKSGG